MNEFVPDGFDERVEHLALGLEPQDAQRGRIIGHAIGISFDEQARGLRRPAIERHPSCRHVVRYFPGLGNTVDLRLVAPDRRFVPRRLRIPILTLEAARNEPYTHRVRRPALFPGAAYDIHRTATGLRGRVVRDGQPLRWTRVFVTLPGSGNPEIVVGRAHGDDRGEFLLLISPRTIPVGDLVDPVSLPIRIWGPAIAPAPAAPGALDPLWDLPLESAPAPEEPDRVSAGLDPPQEYAELHSDLIEFRLGRTESREFVLS